MDSSFWFGTINLGMSIVYRYNTYLGVSGNNLKKNYTSLSEDLFYLLPIYYHCIVFLLPLNGNSMCNG